MAQPSQTVSTPAVGLVKVWVLPAGYGGSFPWSLNFIEEPRLIPLNATKGIRGSGSATFKLLRSYRDDGAGLTNMPGNVVIGAYCCITIGTALFSFANVVWWGAIQTIQSIEFSGGIDTSGTVTASGIGHIIDGTTTNLLAQAASGGAPTFLYNPPSFNLSTDAGEIIGNKVIDASGTPVFASTSAACGTFWSRSDGLSHILTFSPPDSVPAITLATSAGLTTYLSDTTVPEIFEPRGQTLGNLFDLFINRANGFSWDVYPNSGGGWTLYAFATNDNLSSFDPLYPAQTPIDVDVTGSQVIEVGFSQSSDDQIDSVTVDGAPIVFCASVSNADGNLDLGWNTTQETAYRAGASAMASYATLTPVQKAELNQQVREGASIRDVFELLTVDLTKNVSNPAGQGASSTNPLVPNLLYSNGVVTVDNSTTETPYMPRTRLCRTLPWQIGIKADGTDTRTAAQKAQPTYLEPRLYIYNASGSPQTYFDLMVESGYGEVARNAPCLSMDDRSPGIRVKFSPKEILALGHWTSGVDAVCKLSMGGGSTVSGLYADPSADPYGRCIKPELLVATVAYLSDQRITWTNYRPGVQAAGVRRNVTITAEHLQLWYIHAGAIIGISPTTGADDYVLTNTITRNDWPTVKHLCDLYAAFFFRKRTAAVVKYALPGNLPGWCTIGTLLGQLIERNNTNGQTVVDVSAYTIVESISYDFGAMPSATIATSLPPAPNFGGGAVSPSMGGTLSASLGTTPSLAIQRQQQISQQIKGDKQRQATQAPKGAPASDTNVTQETIAQTAHGFLVGQVIRNGALFTGSNSSTLSDVGIVTKVWDANHYDVTFQGFVYNYAPAGALIPTAGQSAWLSHITAGLYGFTQVTGGIKLFDAISATKIYINPTFFASDSVYDTVTQAAHGFTVGQIVYANGSSYALAVASALASSRYSGMVSRVLDSNNFILTYSGVVTLSATAGAVYFLSDITPGTASTTQAAPTHYQVPVYIGLVGGATALVMPSRGNGSSDLSLHAGDPTAGGGLMRVYSTPAIYVDIDNAGHLSVNGVAGISGTLDDANLTMTDGTASATVNRTGATIANGIGQSSAMTDAGNLTLTQANTNIIRLSSSDLGSFSNKTIFIQPVQVIDTGSGLVKMSLIPSCAPY